MDDNDMAILLEMNYIAMLELFEILHRLPTRTELQDRVQKYIIDGNIPHLRLVN